MTSASAHLPAISQRIWNLKYRLRSADGAPLEATLDDTWAHMAAIPGRKDGPRKRLVFSYDDLSQRSAEAVSASAPEFEGFAHALRDAGYTQSAIPGPRGAIWGHHFVRDGVEVDAHTEREDPMAAEIRFRGIARRYRHDCR